MHYIKSDVEAACCYSYVNNSNICIIVLIECCSTKIDHRGCTCMQYTICLHNMGILFGGMKKNCIMDGNYYIFQRK